MSDAPHNTIAYLIPEFPGQTHIWMWREIVHMREWNVPVRIFSTRRPPARDRARHDFAPAAGAETMYLWPPGVGRAAAAVLWAIFTRPGALWRCLKLALTLPVERNERKTNRLVPLILPACILAREIVRQRIGHVHCHSCSAAAVLCMMNKHLTAVPFSLTLNANIEWWGGAMKEKFEAAEFTIAITQWLLEQMKRDFPTLREDQALLGRIGVDTTKWHPRPAEPDESAAAANGATVLTLARLHPSKGHDVLLRAVAMLHDQGVDLRLRLAGDGPHRGDLEALTRELKLDGRVSFLGSIAESDCIREMHRADVFVLASHAEPLGVAYMEAMAAGIPTIGTAAGGVGEIISSGRDGLLVPPGDAASLAAAIRQLLDDAALRRRLSAAGRQTIVQRFDSRLGAATLYQRIFHRPPPR